jgi:hypothetical protein
VLTAREVFDRFLRLPAPGGRLKKFEMISPLDEYLTRYDATDPATGIPVYDEIALSVPKKFGKSEIGGGTAITELIGGIDPDREVVVVASDLEQSRLFTFQSACRFVRRSPWLSKHLRILKNEITYSQVVVNPDTGARDKQEHVLRILAARDVKSLDGGRQTLTIVDEAHSATIETLSAIGRSPARSYSRIVYLSYAGRRVDSVPQNLWFSVVQRGRKGDDATLALIERRGPDAWRDAPWISERFIEQQRRMWAHVPSIFARYWENEWAAGDEGSFLTTQEIRDAIDLTHVPPEGPQPGYRYGLGLDLGLTHDLTGLVLSSVGPEGRLRVERVHHWRGTRTTPVNLIEVEATVLAWSRLFDAPVHVDQWQGALLAQRLTQQNISITPHTIESSRLDSYASLIKGTFSQRQIKVPNDPELVQQLETIQGEELTRRDRIRFTSGPGQHDDLIVALCLALEAHVTWRDVRGKVILRSTSLGRPVMAEQQGCLAEQTIANASGGVRCPIAGEGASAYAGCRRCPGYVSAVTAHDAHVASGQPWIDLPTFATKHMRPNRWVQDRGVRHALQDWL